MRAILQCNIERIFRYSLIKMSKFSQSRI